VNTVPDGLRAGPPNCPMDEVSPDSRSGLWRQAGCRKELELRHVRAKREIDLDSLLRPALVVKLSDFLANLDRGHSNHKSAPGR